MATPTLPTHASYLGDASLQALPEAIGILRALQKLWLSSNALRVLPSSLAHCTRLQQLWLGNNLFLELPDAVCALNGLTNLWVTLNPLKSLPDGLGRLHRLAWLYVYRGGLCFMCCIHTYIYIFASLHPLQTNTAATYILNMSSLTCTGT